MLVIANMSEFIFVLLAELLLSGTALSVAVAVLAGWHICIVV